MAQLDWITFWRLDNAKIKTVIDLLSRTEQGLNLALRVSSWVGNSWFHLGLTAKDHVELQRFLQKLLQEAKKSASLA